MANKNNMSLLDLLQQVVRLPEYTHQDAIRGIVTEWRQKSPLVEEVVSGQTTFETAISALVAENSKLRYFNRRGDACNTPQFEAVAKETERRFAGILPLISYRGCGRSGLTVDDLTSTFDFSRSVCRTFKFTIPVVLSVILLIWAGLSYFSDQRMWAFGKWALLGGIGFGLFISFGQLTGGYLTRLSERRALAEKTLERARFLDRILKTA